MEARERKIYKVTLVGTVVNALLIVLKFVAGIVGRSSAMVADAVHSLSDFITDAIVLIFVRIAGKPCDRGHEYGHGKYETMATVVIGLILMAAGVGLMFNGIVSVTKSLGGEELPRPGMVTLIVAVVSIISKEWLSRYTVRVGRDTDSPVVTANAWHHRSDAFSSCGTLVGIAGAMFLGEQWRILDPLAAIVVSIFIIKCGYDVMRPSVGELLEASLPEEQQVEIMEMVSSIPGIDNVHDLRTRRIGNTIAVDFHVEMDGATTLAEAHRIVSLTEVAIRRRFGENTIVNAHMEPVSDNF